jgi:hypothetical protein
MIRNAKDTGLRNLSLKGFAQNQVWCEIVPLACELLAWTQMLALTGTVRQLGAQAAAAAPVPRRRPPGPQWSAPAAPPRRPLALGHGDHRRNRPPASPPVRLTSRNNHDDQEGKHQGPWNLPTRRDSLAVRHAQT